MTKILSAFPFSPAVYRLLYTVCCLLFAIYSYGFVDLNLTLSNNPLAFSFVTELQKLVYFNRPLSTWVYLGSITIFFSLYIYILISSGRGKTCLPAGRCGLARKSSTHTCKCGTVSPCHCSQSCHFPDSSSTNKLSTLLRMIESLILSKDNQSKIDLKQINFPWKLIILISLLFSLSYPLLSSDVFKYLFAAKEVLVYHANPHLISPMTFEGDTWLRFMRWIHTPSPYGYLFTAYTIPIYIFGFGKFVPTLYLFKLGNWLWYLLAVLLIGKILTSLKRPPAQIIFSQLFFALNPLILIEWLGSAHNDAIMFSLLLLTIYFLVRSRNYERSSFIFSTLSLVASVGIKFVTVLALPILLLKGRLSAELQFRLLTLVFLATPLFYHYSSQYQPWYVTWAICLAALTSSPLLHHLIIAYSFGSLLRYLPFISTGLWIGTPLQFAAYSFLPPLIILVYCGIRKVLCHDPAY